MMKKICCLLLIFYSLCIFGQKIQIVEANYVYNAPPSMSPMEATQVAFNKARTKALEEKFGTIVIKNSYMGLSNIDGESHSAFSVLGENEVKGEWLGDIESPKVLEIKYIDNMLCVSVYVKGKAQEIISAPIEFSSKVLCNGIDDNSESYDFRAGDDFYMSFRSPIDGYLAIYMLDDELNAFRLLPYQSSNSSFFCIKHDERYVLFSKKFGGDEITTFCEKPIEYNHIYTIFSPNKFTRPLDSGAVKLDNIILPPSLNIKEFQKWFVGLRKFDKNISIDRKTIIIRK